MKITDIKTSKLIVQSGESFTIIFKVIDGLMDSSNEFILDSDNQIITTS